MGIPVKPKIETWILKDLCWQVPEPVGNDTCRYSHRYTCRLPLWTCTCAQPYIQKTSSTSVYTIPQTKKNFKVKFFKIFDENLIGLKPWPEPAALAFQNTRQGQSHHKTVILAWLIVFKGLVWSGFLV